MYTPRPAGHSAAVGQPAAVGRQLAYESPPDLIAFNFLPLSAFDSRDCLDLATSPVFQCGLDQPDTLFKLYNE